MNLANRDLLRRSGFEQRADGGTDGDGRTLNGYAAVFGVPTRINSWEGTFDETVRKGAFKKTLRDATPIMQFDHGRHPMVGSIPIGVYRSLGEDREGLAVDGRLTDNWLVDPVRDAIAAKAITGMSFRFDAIREAWTDRSGTPITPADPDFWEALYMGDDHERGPLQRELIEVRMPEAGPVVFPAYDTTSVSVRAGYLAESVLEDDALRSEVRSALALGRAPGTLENELSGFAELRTEIARAILFGGRPGTRSEAPPAGHPAEQDDPGDDPGDDDAPAGGHPSKDDPQAPPAAERDDAPPADGHPSLSPLEQRRRRLRMDYLARNRVGK